MAYIYGVDIMEDNVEECRKRLYDIWNEAYSKYCSKLRIGTTVENTKYGVGKVTGFKKGLILVSFPENLRKFPIPDAFQKGHLRVKEW